MTVSVTGGGDEVERSPRSLVRARDRGPVGLIDRWMASSHDKRTAPNGVAGQPDPYWP